MTNGAPEKKLSIEVPKLLLDNDYGKLTDEQEAIIKKLDTSSSPESDDEFTNQAKNFRYLFKLSCLMTLYRE